MINKFKVLKKGWKISAENEIHKWKQIETLEHKIQ